MPLSHLKRPLVVAAVLFILVLCLLERLGLFAVEPPAAMVIRQYRPGATVEGRLASGFSPKRAGDRFWLEADTTQGFVHEASRVMVYVSRKVDDRALRPGQRVRLSGTLRPPLRPKNPGGFDEGEFLRERGASMVLHAVSVEVLDADVPLRFKPWAWGDRIHRSVHDYLQARFPRERAAILEGLLLGYKSPLSHETNRAVQDAGAVHLIAPSGAKVAHTAAFALLLCAALRLPRAAGAAATALAGGAYVLIVGPEPPYTRAYFMAVILSLCWLAGRESGSFQALTLSALATLAWEPRALFGAGFQMSYAAMLGVLTAMPRWSPPRAWPGPVRGGLRLLALSFVVQLMLWPLFARIFGRASLAGLLANILLVPYSGFVMLAGFSAWACGLALPRLAPGPVWLAGTMAEGFTRTCALFSSLPWAAVDLPPMGRFSTLVFYLGAAGLLTLPEWRTSVKPWAAAGILCAGLWASRRGAAPEVRVVFLSQKKAQAAVVSSPDGRHVLLADGRVQPAALRDAARALGVRKWEAAGGLSWEGGGLEVPAPGAMELRHGGFRLSWGRGQAEAWTAANGRYCIMTSPSETPRRRCPQDRSRSTRWDGAVWLVSNGETLEIHDQRRLLAFGRPVP